MKNLKSIVIVLSALAIIISTSSCKKNKDDDGAGDGSAKKYVPTRINIRESGTTTQANWYFQYNSKRQITQMRYEQDTTYSIDDLFYLENGNLDYYTNQSNSSPLSTTSFKYDGGLRPIEMSYNGTPEATISHSRSRNTYTVSFLGSSYVLDMDFDDNDHLEGFYSGVDSIRINYLSNQAGVFANVALNPSVIIPFHIFPYNYEFYYLHAHQITDVVGVYAGPYIYSDHQRDDKGNLTSFRMINDFENLIFTITYDLK